jgi:hypothetical protein
MLEFRYIFDDIVETTTVKSGFSSGISIQRGTVIGVPCRVMVDVGIELLGILLKKL